MQIVHGLQGSVGGVFRLSDVVRIPYLVRSAEVGSVTFWRLYKSGLLDNEYKDVRVLALAMYPQAVLHLAKRPNSILNLSGLKIVANSKMTANIIQKIGGAPISILIQETYEGLQRRTVDGVITGYPAITAFKFGEVAPVHIDAELGGRDHGRHGQAEMAEGSRRRAGFSRRERRRKAVANLPARPTTPNGRQAAKRRWQAKARQSSFRRRRRIRPISANLSRWPANWVKANLDGAPVLAEFRALFPRAAEPAQK